jgi:glycerol kinase
VTETTALGAAYLAGLASGLFKDTDDIASRWALDRRFEPQLFDATRDNLYAGWQDVVRRTTSG